MRLSRQLAVAAVAMLALGSAAACRGEDKNKVETKARGTGYEIVRNPKFPTGSTMARLSRSKQLIVGIDTDRPGTGHKDVEDFYAEIAKIVAGQLGLAYNNPDQVVFRRTTPGDRAPSILLGKVDMVAGSYSVADKRRKQVAFAGPFYQAAQDLLIRRADKDTIKGPGNLVGRKVCSVTGSTPLGRIQVGYKQAKATGAPTYAACVDQLRHHAVDAVTTDRAILLGYAARNPGELMVVGKPVSTEQYGIGLKKEDAAFRAFLDDALEKAVKDGDWKRAFDATLGRTGSTAPRPPAVDRH